MSEDLHQVQPPQTLRELFTGFLAIGARSFGGVMPWAHRVMVEERRWLAPADFTETIGLCQFLPGPNIGNASIVLGKRWFGLRGAIVAFLGLFALPFVWVLTLAILYKEVAENNFVKAVVIGVGAAGAGFFIATAIKLAKPLARSPAALVVIFGSLLAIAVGRISLFIVLPVALLLSVVFAYRKML